MEDPSNNNKNNKNDEFDVMIVGDYDKNNELFSKTFPILLNNSEYRHKYINRFDLCLKEEIKFSKDFINLYYPEINDKLMNIDILILTYNLSSSSSIEYLNKFYYLYYNKLEEKDKPKKIIIIEFNYLQKNEIYNVKKLVKK